MKLPNKYGSVTKLSGNRRNPFMVREGVSGKQKILAYTATKEEGLQVLAKFNKSPWNYNEKPMTLGEIYQCWLKNKEESLSVANQRCLKSAWLHCQELQGEKYAELKLHQLQSCIDGCGKGYATQSAIRNLFQHLERFCAEMELQHKKIAYLLKTESISPSKKEIFSRGECHTLWEAENDAWVDSILIFLHTGFRISELLNLKKSQVDLENGTMTGGCKTKAGKNRVIPIHSAILPLIENRMTDSGEYLLSHLGEKCNEQWYRGIWKNLMKKLNMKHTPHECRHTFRSLLDSAGANQVCIDRLMGHSSQGTGQRVYTHKTIEELRENLELVTI